MSIESVLLVVAWTTKKHHVVDPIFPKRRTVFVEGMMNVEVVTGTTMLTTNLLIFNQPRRISEPWKRIWMR
jgi:hypothetical protein